LAVYGNRSHLRTKSKSKSKLRSKSKSKAKAVFRVLEQRSEGAIRFCYGTQESASAGLP